MMTMHERIAAGKLFTDACEGLSQERTAAKLKMIWRRRQPCGREKRMYGKDVDPYSLPRWYRLSLGVRSRVPLSTAIRPKVIL